MSKKNWNSEFDDFSKADPAQPPVHLREQIGHVVEGDLKAAPWKAFSKLSLIHLISAVFTLSVCPQFGFRIFGEGMGLMYNFMGFGDHGCMLACGFFFMSVSLLFAVVLLRPYELLAIRRYRITEIGSMALLSLGFLIMIGAEQVFLSLTIAWLLGATIGGVFVLELGWAWRRLGQVNAS